MIITRETGKGRRGEGQEEERRGKKQNHGCRHVHRAAVSRPQRTKQYPVGMWVGVPNDFS